MYYITEGEGWVYHSQQKVHLKPGNLYIIPSFTVASYLCPEYMEQYYIHFIQELDGGLSIYDMYNFQYENPASEVDVQLVERLLFLNPDFALPHSNPDRYKGDYYLHMKNRQESLKNNPGIYLENRGILYQLLAKFIIHINLSAKREQKPFKNRLTPIVKYIIANLGNKICIKDLSDLACLSEDYFSRIFLETFGVRPVEFINRKRIEKAQLLLLTTQFSQKEIADQLGFAELSYFSKIFKKYTQLTPKQFKHNQSFTNSHFVQT